MGELLVTVAVLLPCVAVGAYVTIKGILLLKTGRRR